MYMADWYFNHEAIPLLDATSVWDAPWARIVQYISFLNISHEPA